MASYDDDPRLKCTSKARRSTFHKHWIDYDLVLFFSQNVESEMLLANSTPMGVYDKIVGNVLHNALLRLKLFMCVHPFCLQDI